MTHIVPAFCTLCNVRFSLQDGKMKALEICRLVADRTANLSRHGLDRYINQFENDTTALFIVSALSNDTQLFSK